MPVSPYTWQTNDYLTAFRLNSELYRTLGQYFAGNGIGWHAAKPIYKAFYPTNAGFTAGNWATMATPSTAGGWTVVADSAGLQGGRGDPKSIGEYGIAFGAANSGGGPASPAAGGLGIFMTSLAFGTVPSGSASIIRAGLGNANGTAGNPPLMTGTQQGTNSVNPNSPWALDIMDLNQNHANGPISAWVNAGGSPKNITDNADGSHREPYLQGFWHSVYPANGTTVASLPTPASSWTGTSPVLTASYMNGLTGIAAVMNLLNMPPLCRVTSLGSATTVAANTAQTYNCTSVTYDTYSAYNNVSMAYTVPLSGLYLCYALFPFDSGPTVTCNTKAGINVNGTDYWGPLTPIAVAQPSGLAIGVAAAKVQVFSLNAGDVVKPRVFQTGSNSAGSSTYNCVLIVAYLGTQGTPSPLPVIPDITFSWAAGTPGSSMPGLMNSHFANDLNFLVKRPYLMAYQTTAQTGIAMATPTQLSLNNNTGIVHADAGDNYSGWNGSTTYTAQRSGWYLAVTENFMATPSLTATPTQGAGFQVTPAGTTNYDLYQVQNAAIATANGSAAVSLYYLRVGDTISPIVYSQTTSATTTATTVGTGNDSHFELVWISE